MVFIKFDNLWTLISSVIFGTDSDSQDGDLTCMICKKVVTDKSPCGYQYCHKCIQEYLGDESKYFPGDKEECKEERILLDKNVCKNGVLNKKISKLRVHCPNQSCPFTDELTKMEDHILFCTSQEEECPYSILGCDSKRGPKDIISAHLYEDSFKHNHLLIEYIKNMRNELSFELNNEFRNESSNYETLNSEIKRLNEDLENTKLELNIWKFDSISKDNEIEELKKALSESKIESKNTQIEIKSLYHSFTVYEKEIKTQGMEIKLLKENEERRKSEKEKEMKIDFFNKYYPIRNPNILSKSLNVDFVWRVERISMKEGLEIFSDSFMSHNYRLCLYLQVLRDSCYVGGAIMKGEKDDEVEWPLKLELRVSILNQDSLRCYQTNNFSSDIYAHYKERPTSERNDAMYNNMYNLSYLKDQPLVLVRDSLLISGVLSDP